MGMGLGGPLECGIARSQGVKIWIGFIRSEPRCLLPGGVTAGHQQTAKGPNCSPEMTSSQHYEQALLPQSGGRVQSRVAKVARVGLFLPGTLLVTMGAQLF